MVLTNQSGVSSSFGGFGSADAQKAALRDAILQARNTMPSQFLGTSANYLVGLFKNGTLSTNDIQTLAPSINVNLLDQPSLSFFSSLLANRGGTPSPTPPLNPNPPNSNPNGSLSTTFKTGLQGLLSSIGPTGLVIGIVVIGFVMLRK